MEREKERETPALKLKEIRSASVAEKELIVRRYLE